jgi:hypothetical protein
MARKKHPTLPKVSFAVVLLGAVPVFAQGATSRYLTFDIDKCATIERDGETGSVRLHCKHPTGYQLHLTDDDARMSVGFGPNGRKQRSIGQTLNPLNSIHNVLELRYMPGATKPHAAIMRYHTGSSRGEEGKGQVLVVTKLAGDDACQVAHIDAVANQDANELARQTADNVASFDCAKDEPNVVGKTGKSPM